MVEESESYRVRLEVFEGPMDLLLHLIRKNEIDIYDIPIALITKQYLEYLELMKMMNLDIAGEFLTVASELMYIKSRTLLPKPEPEEEEEEGPDPRNELVRRLLEYQQYKEAAEKLREYPLLGRDVFTRRASSTDWVEVSGDELAPVSLFSMVDAFQKMLERVGPDEVEVMIDRISVRERIVQLIDKLKGVKSITFEEIFEGDKTRSRLIVTFLAILEMVRLAVMKVHQGEEGGVIRLFPVGDIEEASPEKFVKDDYI